MVQGPRTDCRVRSKTKVANARAENEAKALHQLTSRGCDSAPNLLAYYTIKREGLPLEHYVVMSKVPGFDVGYTAWKDREQLGKIRMTFRSAIRDVHRCGVDNGSHRARNLIYDEVNDKWSVTASSHD